VLVPSRKREPPSGFDDPAPSNLEPIWFRTVPEPHIRQAIEAAGLNWDDVLKDLQSRRDAMVNGNEWDVYFENGKIVWHKPKQEVLAKRLEGRRQTRDWGLGWRKYVVWGVWKMVGSPEGVFETEEGTVDGKLVLRKLPGEKE
jgi:hypothetical protein